MSLPISIKEMPFVRLIIPFLAGIACQYWISILSFSWWNYTIVLLLLTATFFSFFLASSWRFRWIFGFVINLSLFFFGIILTIKQPVTDKLVVDSSNRVILYLLDNPQLRTKSIRAEAEVRSVFKNKIWWPAKEKMLVYFDAGDSLAPKLRYGDEVAADFVPQMVAQMGNPEQFNFQKYLSDRGVNFTAHIKPNNWLMLRNDGAFVKRTALNLRDKLVLLFKSYGLSGDELAVASALTLGYQDLLDDELRQVYSSSGAMHILSVSGLHVGILYVLLSFILSFLDRRILTRAIKALILLVFLWFFALITGLPPCVQRSALMFSFLVIGDFFNRKSNIYNTLAASAFVLLVINPYNLLDVGFQLSYLAVVSIVFFYPYIYKLIYVKNWALDKVWSLAAVSMAAQLGTLSICIYYFNQFPNYFLLANLIAIPLSTIALYLSVFLIIVSPFHMLAGFVGKAFSFTVSLLNHGLEYIEKLPYSVSQGLHISAIQMFVVIGVIVVLSVYLITQRTRFIHLGLSLIAFFLILNLKSYITRIQTKEFVVYNINKKSLVSFRIGEKILFIDVDTTKEQFAEKYNFFVKGYVSSVGATNKLLIVNPLQKEVMTSVSMLEIKNQYGVSFIHFMNKTVAIPFDRTLNSYKVGKKFKVDYLVINRYFPYKVLDLLKPSLVIIDSSVSKHVIKDIKLKCIHAGIPYYITSLQGACVISVNDI